MKKNILLFLLLVSGSAFSQPTTVALPAIQTNYLEKSRHQSTAAHLFLWGGLTVALTGVIISHSSNTDPVLWWSVRTDEPYDHTGDYIAFTGLVCMIASVPFFFAASGNKRKAAGVSVMLKMEKSPSLYKQSFVQKSFPVLSARIILKK